jgi:hypothetical protein
MSALNDVQNGSLRSALGYSCKTKAGLAIHGAAAATVDSLAAITVAIDGVLKTKTQLSQQSVAVTHDCFGNAVGGNNLSAYVQPTGTTVYYVLATDGTNVAVVQGSYAGQSLAFPNDLSKILTGKGGIPAEPAGYTAFGMLKVVTSGGATFTPGTDALDKTNVTVTYYDLERIPSVAP